MRMSKLLHRIITYNLLRASFPKFYNVILTGRIMNRLSGDIYNVDKAFPDMIMNINTQFIEFINIILLFIISGAYIYIIPLFALFIFGLLLNFVYL